MQDMGELLDSMEPLKPLRRGDIVEGDVMRVDSEGILVNIGHKAEGIVPTREMRTLDQTEFDSLGVGDEVVTYVIRPESAEQSAILSIDRAMGETCWRDLEKSLEAGETVEGKIIGFNRGGAIVEVYKVQGFVPMSQLVSVSRDIFRDTATEAKAQSSSGSLAAASAIEDPILPTGLKSGLNRQHPRRRQVSRTRPAAPLAPGLTPHHKASVAAP